MTEEKEVGFDKVKEGFKKVVGGSAEVVEGSAQEIKEAVEDTSEDIKQGAEETGEEIEEGVDKVTDSDTYTGNEDTDNREYNKSGGKEPMNPEDIASHEPTAVQRDQDTEISNEGQTRTDSPEAQEKYRKKGMTET
jgi:hypothetical protein